MRKVWLGAAIALAASAPAWSAPVPGPARPITDPKSVVSLKRTVPPPAAIKDLFATKAAADAAWTPDGKWLVMSANFSGRFNIWKVPVGGGEPVQLAKSNDRQNGVIVSPDGQWVVFQSDHGGNEMWDLYAVPLAGGEVVNLTNSDTVSETNPRFSPDGKLLAIAVKPKASPIANVAVLDFATRKVRQLTHEATSDNGWQPAGFTPDGKALIANRQDVGSTSGSIWRIALADGGAKALTHGKGLVSADDVSPDGKRLAITSNVKGGTDQAGLMDVATGKVTWLSPSAWEQSSRAFSPDGGKLVFAANTDGRQDLLAFDLKTGKAAKLPLPAGFNSARASGTGPFNRAGDLLVGHDASNTPFDYWTLSKAGKATRVTRLAALNSADVPVSSIVHYKSADGTVISAILSVPFNLKRDGSAPAVVVPHGGPTGQTQDRFSRQTVALVSRGYVVIQPNPRGSTGYGMAFQNANHKDLGGGDLSDEVHAAKFLAATGYVNPKKIGITGGSYGGFMTLMAVGKTPDVWAAGVEQYGIINWYEMLKHEDAALQAYQRSLIGDPVADKAVYDADSPMTYIKQTKAPLLVLQGENDIRVPRGQAAEVVATLKSIGATVDAHYYPEEGHGFVKLENQIDALQRTVDWFDKYLK